MRCDVYLQWFTNTSKALQPLATTNNKLGGVFPHSTLSCISFMIFHIFFTHKQTKWKCTRFQTCVWELFDCKKNHGIAFTHTGKRRNHHPKRTTSSSRSREWDICHYTLFSSHTINNIISLYIFWLTTDLTPPWEGESFETFFGL